MRLLQPTVQIWMKLDPYYQRQKCRPMNLVSENIRFMRIFAGIPLGAGVKPHWGLSTTAIFGALGGYVFENFTDTASTIIWRHATNISGSGPWPSGSRDVIGHVTIEFAMGHFLYVFHYYWHSISKGFRDIEAQMYLGHGFDLSRSRDVIGNVIILSAICGFL